MQHTAAEVIAVFHRDLIAGVIAIVLITMGAGMLLLGALTAGKSRRSFVCTGLFAIAYGTRLAFNTGAFTMLYGHPRWLDYLRSDFEYLVPIPAALLFASFSGNRRPLLHRIIGIALISCAAIAIPFEIAMHSPFALKPVIDALVLVLIAVLAIDLLSGGSGDTSWRFVRIGASAGHPPPILRHDETCEEVIAPGVVLGRFRDARYEEVSRPFVPGDTLVLYTDGVTETANRVAEIWGDERLRAAIGSESPHTLLAKIIAEVEAWRGVGGPPEDDVTMIVVRRA